MTNNANGDSGVVYSKWNHIDPQSPYHARAQKLVDITGYNGCNYFSPTVLEKLEQACLIADSIKLRIPDDFCLLSTKSGDSLKKKLVAQSLLTVDKIDKCFAEYSRRKILEEIKNELKETLAHISHIASLEEREVITPDFVISMFLRNTKGAKLFYSMKWDGLGVQASQWYWVARFIKGDESFYKQLILNHSGNSEFTKFFSDTKVSPVISDGNAGQNTLVPDLNQIWDTLNQEFPWMYEINLSLVRSLAMLRSGKIESLQPMLLVGDSGIGKTHWCLRVSELLNLPKTLVPVAGAMSGASISGFESTWKNSEPSIVSKTIADNDGRAVIVMDEIDKSSTNTSGGLVTDALLPLLNKETARQYRDMNSSRTLDASKIVWMFTANSLSTLTTPFLDRVKIMHVNRPRKNDLQKLFERIQEQSDPNHENKATDIIAMTHAYEERGSIRAAIEALEEETAKREWSPPQDAVNTPTLRLV